jgi:lipoprotein signal peptidase
MGILSRKWGGFGKRLENESKNFLPRNIAFDSIPLMKKCNEQVRKIGQIFICFSLPWLLFVLFSLLGREVYYSWGQGTFWQKLIQYPKQPRFCYNFIPALLLFCIGMLVNYISDKKPATRLHIIFTVIILIFIDQAIQFLVVRYHESIKISIVTGWLEIIPKSMMENKGRYLSNGQIPVSLRWLLYVPIMGVFYFLYRCFCFFYEQDRTLLTSYAVINGSGLVCSILDTILYANGSYDYIVIYPLIIFDIRDIYLSVGTYTFWLSVARNATALRKLTLKDMLQYFKWEYTAWKTIFVKLKYFFTHINGG